MRVTFLTRKIAKTCNIRAFLTSFVIVTIFVCSREKYQITSRAEQQSVTANIDKTNNVKDTRRSLLKFTFQRKMKFEDSMLNKKLKFESWHELLKTKLRQPVEGTFTETTPKMTDKPTPPITTQSDTTPLFTESPTSPITTESITTPILTEPGVKEVTTDKEKIWIH